MNIHFPRVRMIIGSAIEFGCADVPAVEWCRISSMNVMGWSWSAECCMPGMSCIASSGFGVGIGVAPCWCCDGPVPCAEAVTKNGINIKIIKTARNESFIDDPYPGRALRIEKLLLAPKRDTSDGADVGN